MFEETTKAEFDANVPAGRTPESVQCDSDLGRMEEHYVREGICYAAWFEREGDDTPKSFFKMEY